MSAANHIDGLAATVDLPPGELHLAVGMFDGVHLGHRAVLDAAVHSARRTGGVAAALTFDPHPSRLLRLDKAVSLIQPVGVKVDRMLLAGLSRVITQNFTKEFAAIPAEEFVANLHHSLPQLTTIYVGENWRFGRGRIGDVNLLNETASKLGLSVLSAPRVSLDGKPISSTRIRAALLEGKIEQVNRLLGYAYRSQSEVSDGRKLGRTMGFPTLNLPWAPECQPKRGVYAVEVQLKGDDRVWQGVANYGVRPTVESTGGDEPVLEVHLFEVPPFGTGAKLRVDWVAFLRSEKRFDNIEPLRDQITMDRGAAMQWFERDR